MHNSCFLVKYNRICKFWLSLNGWVAHGVAASHVGYIDGRYMPNRSKRGPMKSDVKCPCVRESVNEGPRSCRDECPVGSCHKVGSHFHVISSIIVGVLITVIPVPRFTHVSRIYTSFSQSFTVICNPCVSIRTSILLGASVVPMICTRQFRPGAPSVSGF